MMEKWIRELVLDTIVAALFALLFYIIGVDKSWEDVSRTYLTAFIVMFALGAYKKIKNKDTI